VSFPSSVPEQLDRAIDRVLAGEPPGRALDTSVRPLVGVAAALRSALGPVPPSASFERRLAERLNRGPETLSAFRAVPDLLREQLRHPARLLVTGAVSSAALGVGVTAYAVWRGSRRPSGVAHRLVHR
jgi:hypothetical protein